MKGNRGDSSNNEIATVPPKKRSQPLHLGKHVDEQIQLYLCKIRENGGIVTASVGATAREIMRLCDCTQLVEFGGHTELSRVWAYPFARSNEICDKKSHDGEKQTCPQRFHCSVDRVFGWCCSCAPWKASLLCL